MFFEGFHVSLFSVQKSGQPVIPKFIRYVGNCFIFLPHLMCNVSQGCGENESTEHLWT